jgi:hypothetical protein
MSRTTRRAPDGHPFRGYWLTILRLYDHKRETRNRYALYQFQAGREIGWLKSIAAKNDEELMAEAVLEDARSRRDGRSGFTETERNMGFKRQCAQTTRLANRRYCQRVMRDPEYWYATSAPRSSDTDGYVWDWW